MPSEPVAQLRDPWWLTRARPGDAGSLERRAHERALVGWRVHVSVGPERTPAAAIAHDVSARGLLIAFDAPTGLAVGQRVLSAVEIEPPDRLLLLGEVVRIERARDFRTYVALSFDRGQPDLAAWCRAQPAS